MSSSPSPDNLLKKQQKQHPYSSYYLSKLEAQTTHTPPYTVEDMLKGRKRRASFEDEEMLNDESELMLTVTSHHDINNQITKRCKLNTNRNFTISKTLVTLDKNKLIELISDLVSSNPYLKKEVDAFIPPPTLNTTFQTIQSLESKVNDSFPYNKAIARDDYTFNRVKPGLIELANTLIEYADYFTCSTTENPDTIFLYLNYATCVANRLPNWDKEEVNNRLKNDLYAKLKNFWAKTMDIVSFELSQGKIFGKQVITEWEKQIIQHNNETQGLFSEIVQQFEELLGWIQSNGSTLPSPTIAPRNNFW